MKHVNILGLVFVSLWIAAVPGWAVDGKTLANACIACHGQNGVSNSPIWPNLAAQKKDYLIKQIKAFKDGGRVDPMMSPTAANLSDEEIEALALYFSTLKQQ